MHTGTSHIIQADLQHLEAASQLFNQYRQFYKQDDDLPACREFLRENMLQQRAHIFLLLDGEGQAVALAQLYPCLCSIALQPFYLLSDLFVSPDARQQGYAAQLMDFLSHHYRQLGALRLSLETAHDNLVAQHLYTTQGYQRDTVFRVYHKPL